MFVHICWIFFDPSKVSLLVSWYCFICLWTLYFFWIVVTREICWYGFLKTLKQLLNLTPVQTILWPQASCTECEPTAIWNINPWPHTDIMKLWNLLLLFSRVNLASVRPISHCVGLVQPTKSVHGDLFSRPVVKGSVQIWFYEGSNVE